ncbi:WxL domain-containing protein [Vagococcus silagei]|uniref:WxL domain-containing protein n=1 Tax=Vagococcus silagei TaxID=2508885 RepID=A0A4S3B600_9ENTE|nr:WxL domain-containing protein [Vagococcus silagei]THB62332.1 WxL domain-containing protein [Vagococcus silagei]
MKKSILLISTLCLGGLLVAVPAVHADGGAATTKGYIKFSDGDDDGGPSDPGDEKDPDDKTKPIVPTKPVDPGKKTDGPLRFVYIPNVDFGDSNVIKTVGKAYYYARFPMVDDTKERPNFFEVSDARGGGKGWTVTLSNNGVFKNGSGHEIKANLYVNGMNIRSNSQLEENFYPELNKNLSDTINGTPYMRVSSNTVLAKADGAKKQGFGRWSVRFGSTANKIDQKVKDGKIEKRNPAVALEVLPGMKDTSSGYSTDLVWEITDGK